MGFYKKCDFCSSLNISGIKCEISNKELKDQVIKRIKQPFEKMSRLF